MLDDLTYDFLLQVCEGVQGKVKVYEKKKIDYRYCEECNVERMIYPHLDFTYARAVVYAVLLFPNVKIDWNSRGYIIFDI